MVQLLTNLILHQKGFYLLTKIKINKHPKREYAEKPNEVSRQQISKYLAYEKVFIKQHYFLLLHVQPSCTAFPGSHRNAF